MNQHWQKYVEEYEELEERELRKAYKSKPKKLDHKQEQKLKETKKNGVQYPKKPKQ